MKRPASANLSSMAKKCKDDGFEMPPATLQEFYQFLQCQLKKEVEVHMSKVGKTLTLEDNGAVDMWPEYEAFVKPNLGGTERWVPFHTIFGVHELFLVKNVHHVGLWDEYQRFQAIFIFRAHCKGDLFQSAQLPTMLKKGFWANPKEAFRVGGIMEKTMLEYRRTTHKPLLTLCFRMIPERILKDDDENLVRNIILCTGALLDLAERIYPIIKSNKDAAKKFDKISEMVQNTHGLGETWAEMLTVCIDLAYPDSGLLASQCDVGIGAATPLRRLLPDRNITNNYEALEELQEQVNSSAGPSVAYFWKTLNEAEEIGRECFKSLPLVLRQVNTSHGGLSSVTLQVQLCEYRQFRHALARNKYGLPHDESMKEPERERRLRPEDYLERDEQQKLVTFACPLECDADPTPFKTSVAASGDSWKVAEGIAILCFNKLKTGTSKEDVEALQNELYRGVIRGMKDVPDDSAAWDVCRVKSEHRNPLVSFAYQHHGAAKKISFQTTVGAAGSVVQAERVARLCYARFQAGASKEDVLRFRGECYTEIKELGMK